MQGVRDFIKYQKGIYKTYILQQDLRNDRITKEEAEKMIKEYEGKRPQTGIFLGMLD